MGLSEFVDETTSLVPNPVGLLPTAVARYLPSWVRPSVRAPDLRNDEEEILAQERQWQEEADRGEAERLYLSYSWWLLNVGWRTVASRVEEGVQRVFAGWVRDMNVACLVLTDQNASKARAVCHGLGRADPRGQDERGNCRRGISAL